ncbi:siderophore biosynthesis protein SbnG [Brevibacillus agri]|uniref:Siderophore biosynthesis protein SbnG n=1 Tax=Brevibacillus agri TaxID=51101 RepID=A0A3M8BD55_9BACL|nr:aldolase/citrate lyase family protein [Brevibacillus agri]QAV14013.1 siderophore biosynthesis protein SbnG [Brevibacillus agri]RNB60887.1 siderophore biosynthesis protein SbnG [Brevibacillus agri]GED24441.1 siderophore biosynthesis protein SbnG [Brevibacillus agri]
MLKENTLKRKLREGKTVYGLFCSIPAPVVVEMIGCAEYDFVIIDTEHVLVNPETLENMIRAAEAAQITPLVRVANALPGTILRALDSGAQGIVVPHVESREQAEQIVRSSRYYPLGTRSLNSGRPGAFGKNDLVLYLERANAEIMVVPMIESRAGVERITDILDVPGIDMVLEGAADLSQSYGRPWDTRGELVKTALQSVQAAALSRGVPYCAIPRAAEDMDEWFEKGVRAYVLGDERGIAFRALRHQLGTMRDKEQHRKEKGERL